MAQARLGFRARGIVIAAFAVAMAYVEAAVVVYLRRVEGLGAGARVAALVMRLLAIARPEPVEGPWLRGIASVMALAAGVIHLAQVGIHLAEGWMFVAFFMVVGGAARRRPAYCSYRGRSVGSGSGSAAAD